MKLVMAMSAMSLCRSAFVLLGQQLGMAHSVSALEGCIGRYMPKETASCPASRDVDGPSPC